MNDYIMERNYTYICPACSHDFSQDIYSAIKQHQNQVDEKDNNAGWIAISGLFFIAGLMLGMAI